MSGLTLYAWSANKDTSNPKDNEKILDPNPGDELFVYFGAEGAGAIKNYSWYCSNKRNK